MATMIGEPTLEERTAQLRQQLERTFDQAQQQGKLELAYRCLLKMHQLIVLESRQTLQRRR